MKKNLTKKEKKFLLDLAKKSLFIFLTKKEILTIPEPTEFKGLLKKAGVFVTLKKQGDLRGCIGSLVGQEPVYKEVIKNTINAAFNDPRFPKLSKEEFNKNLEIEISVLSPLKEIKLKKEKLLKHLNLKKPGVFIASGPFQATFLPQVWEEIGQTEDFLNNLCFKAGLGQYCWQNRSTKLYQYQVESFKEKI